MGSCVWKAFQLGSFLSHWQSLLAGSDGKDSACNVGDPGLIPGLGRSPGEGNGNPLQYSSLGNPRDRGAWWAILHGVTKSRTRPKRLSTYTYIKSPLGHLQNMHYHLASPGRDIFRLIKMVPLLIILVYFIIISLFIMKIQENILSVTSVISTILWKRNETGSGMILAGCFNSLPQVFLFAAGAYMNMNRKL